ncbi:MAG: hypothetical protein WDO13_03080 [Verrucomicrobiota bacterium]
MLRQFGFELPEKNASVSDFWQAFQRDSDQAVELAPASDTVSGALVLPQSAPLPAALPAGTAHPLAERTAAPTSSPCRTAPARSSSARRSGCSATPYLGRGDNLAIVLKLLEPGGTPPRHVFFEESHHGFYAVYAIVRLWKHPGVRFAVMLALLGALAFLASSLVRFGPVIPLHRPAGRSTLEFVDSIADLYLRADLRDDTLKVLFAETQQQVLARLNLPSPRPRHHRHAAGPGPPAPAQMEKTRATIRFA